MHRGIAILGALLAMPLLAGTAQARILSVHDLAKDPKRYDGQYVVVRGVVDFGPPHTSTLLNSKAEFERNRKKLLSEAEAERSCITIVGSKAFYTSDRGREKMHGRTVTVGGYFTADMYNGGEGVNLWGCQVNNRALGAVIVYRRDD